MLGLILNRGKCINATIGNTNKFHSGKFQLASRLSSSKIVNDSFSFHLLHPNSSNTTLNAFKTTNFASSRLISEVKSKNASINLKKFDKKSDSESIQMPKLRPNPIVSEINSELDPQMEKNATVDKFSEANLDQRILRGIKELGYEFMTPIQSLIAKNMKKGQDCFGQAKTGSGKTVAFLIPAIQNMAERKGDGSSIEVLIVTPTRELAIQIAKESALLTRHLPQIKTVLAIGGTNIRTESVNLKERSRMIVVGTPGRLMDHMNDQSIQNRFNSSSNRFCLILDEADQLLEEGFMPSVEKIVAKIPPKSERQTFFFSATVPNKIKELASKFLNSGYQHFNTIPEGETETHTRVPQTIFFSEAKEQNPLLVTLLKVIGKKEAPPKVIVFCPTARGAGFLAEVLEKVSKSEGFPSVPIFCLHSRLTQSKRTQVTNQFKEAQDGILVSSDVSSRGMDFPKVTHVIQLGSPQTLDQYVHRLGRTGRAGREGSGIIILDPIEAPFHKQLLSQKKIDFVPFKYAEEMKSDSKKSVLQVETATRSVDKETKEKAFKAWIGQNRKLYNPSGLIDAAVNYSRHVLGLNQVPALTAQFIGKVGLSSLKSMMEVVSGEKEKSYRFKS